MTLRLNGSTSGYTEIDAPAVAGSNTLVLPTGNGTSGQVLSTNGSGALSWVDRFIAAGPAFSARRTSSVQTVSQNTWTKIQYNSEDFDTASCFDSSTNYRFTPNIAGYYQVTASASSNNIAGGQYIAIYKNGSNWIEGRASNYTTINAGVSVTGLVYLNGSTDYIEGYIYLTTAGNAVYNESPSYFQGFLARPA